MDTTTNIAGCDTTRHSTRALRELRLTAPDEIAQDGDTRRAAWSYAVATLSPAQLRDAVYLSVTAAGHETVLKNHAGHTATG